jgi:5'-nucleotidase
MLRWVFLDIGNVLMNDDPTMALIYRELQRSICASGYRITFADLLAERERLIRERGPEHWTILARKYLGERGHRRLMEHCASMIRADYMACHSVLPGMKDAVRELAGRYRLGVIANQLRDVSVALDEIGIGKMMEVRAISEIIGIRKPDPEIYRWACSQAGCEPREAVMVGDRVDNDVIPARAIGLWTILFRMSHEGKGAVPADEMEALYYESQRRESISKISPLGPDENPDCVASDAVSLLRAIEEVRKRCESASEEECAGR